jgi:hypothetical protein
MDTVWYYFERVPERNIIDKLDLIWLNGFRPYDFIWIIFVEISQIYNNNKS